jgi:hypothetical protein
MGLREGVVGTQQPHLARVGSAVVEPVGGQPGVGQRAGQPTAGDHHIATGLQRFFVRVGVIRDAPALNLAIPVCDQRRRPGRSQTSNATPRRRSGWRRTVRLAVSYRVSVAIAGDRLCPSPSPSCCPSPISDRRSIPVVSFLPSTSALLAGSFGHRIVSFPCQSGTDPTTLTPAPENRAGASRSWPQSAQSTRCTEPPPTPGRPRR